MNSTQKKFVKLRKIIQQAGSAVIAFSGGVDSTFLTRVAHDELSDNALAVTAQSETYPGFQLEEAKRIASLIGVRHRIVISEELDIPGFSHNAPDRCYHCKKELYMILKRIADEEGILHVYDGSNLDDVGDFRT